MSAATRPLGIAITLVIVLVASAFAADTGTISGAVFDQGGQPVPDATVKISGATLPIGGTAQRKSISARRRQRGVRPDQWNRRQCGHPQRLESILGGRPDGLAVETLGRRLHASCRSRRRRRQARSVSRRAADDGNNAGRRDRRPVVRNRMFFYLSARHSRETKWDRSTKPGHRCPTKFERGPSFSASYSYAGHAASAGGQLSLSTEPRRKRRNRRGLCAQRRDDHRQRQQNRHGRVGQLPRRTSIRERAISLHEREQ
jgi:hypothetical protein